MEKNKYYFLSCIMMLLLYVQGSGQPSIFMPKNEYGVQLVNNIQILQETIQADSNKQMVSLTALIPNIVLDLRYATTNNFMHRSMYPAKTNITFMRLPAAKALQSIQTGLNTKGYGLKIFDGYRPYAVTKKFWELVHDERYVANPSRGSGHNKGIAVDLTIIDLSTGKELDMGTGFDNFTDSAHHVFTALPANVMANRKLLKETMEQYGFKLFDTEWWHYSWPGEFEVLDISHEDLSKMHDDKKQ